MSKTLYEKNEGGWGAAAGGGGSGFWSSSEFQRPCVGPVRQNGAHRVPVANRVDS
jgi:hypothetical protein